MPTHISPRCNLSVRVFTEKLKDIERKAWWQHSEGFRKLVYFPGMDYDTLQGQLRPGEMLCCWYYPEGNMTISSLIHIVPASFEECLQHSESNKIVGFYALTSAFRKEIRSLQ